MTLHPRLTLEHPLAFFDLETTGRYPDRDRIVDITIKRVEPDGRWDEFSSLVNPTIPIPPSATAVHGITDADVQSAPTFRVLAPAIGNLLSGVDVAGYNVRRFDLPLLSAEFRRVGAEFSMDGRRVIDAQAIFFKREPRDLTSALKFFCGTTLDGAHRASADVDATIKVLRGQFDRYPDLPATVEALHDYCKDPSWVDETGRIVWDDGVACIAFGKHAGVSLQHLASARHTREYLSWLCSADFPDDTKRIVRAALAGTFPAPVVKEAAHVNAF